MRKNKKGYQKLHNGKSTTILPDAKISTHYFPRRGKHPWIFLPGLNREQRYERQKCFTTQDKATLTKTNTYPPSPLHWLVWGGEGEEQQQATAGIQGAGYLALCVCVWEGGLRKASEELECSVSQRSCRNPCSRGNPNRANGELR